MKILKLIALITALYVAGWLVDESTPYDATDNATTETRSGLSLRTDHGTGCQYLSRGYFSGLIPRTDYNGNHMGCSSE